jgi:hypothetical protein
MNLLFYNSCKSYYVFRPSHVAFFRKVFFVYNIIKINQQMYNYKINEVFLSLTEVFPCFFLGCKANARVKLAKTGHGPHSSTLVVICVVRLLFVLFYIPFVFKRVLPPGDNTIAVNKYIISYIIKY